MILQAVLVLKYVVPEYGFPALYFGIANVIANGLIMLRFDYSKSISGSAWNADGATVRLSSGCHRIWKMTILTTWPFDLFCTTGLSVHHAIGLKRGA